MEAGLHADDSQRGLVGGRGWLEESVGVEGGDGVTAICGSTKVYWDSHGIPKDAGSGGGSGGGC